MDIFDEQSIQVQSTEQMEVENEIANIKKGISFVKYTPDSIDDAILPDDFKTAIKSTLSSGYLDNHYMFYGTNGIGKSMTAELIFESLDIPYRKWNCSKTKNLAIADEISDFLKITTVDGKPKGVIMDELGANYSEAFMEAMKGVMDDYNDVGRFIVTTNHYNKVNEGIRDRCTRVNFGASSDVKAMKNQMYKRLLYIAKDIVGEDNIMIDDKVDTEASATIINIINHHYPRVRSMIDSLSYNAKTNDGKAIKGDQFIVHSSTIKTIHSNILSGDWKEARISFNQLVIDPIEFIEPFIDYVTDHSQIQHQGPISLICARWAKGILSEVSPEQQITCGMFSELMGFYEKMGYINNGTN
jgi:hypothetical protein